MAGRTRQTPVFSGDLQVEVMDAVWRLGEAQVEDVRALQPARRRSAYTTVQTVMNRLVDRGMLTRDRRGQAYVYRPRYSEAEYLSRTIDGSLRRVSPQTRQAVMLNLVDRLEPDALDAIAGYAERIRQARESAGE